MGHTTLLRDWSVLPILLQEKFHLDYSILDNQGLSYFILCLLKCVCRHNSFKLINHFKTDEGFSSAVEKDAPTNRPFEFEKDVEE